MIKESELIINKDGSIYHLQLLPEDIADTIILVGDPGRVSRVSKHFDSIRVQKERREFITHTGRFQGKELTVLSSGIGTDNIDIVINEIDALANVDFQTRRIKEKKRTLAFVRIGTTGGIHPKVPVDKFVVSRYGLGMDGLGGFYPHEMPEDVARMLTKFEEVVSPPVEIPTCYAARGDHRRIDDDFSDFIQGITLTATGFYGPQGRSIRLKNRMSDIFGRIQQFEFEGIHCTNLEMETSGIYLLAQLLGHKAMSCNVVLANRVNKTFSQDPGQGVDKLIQAVLERL